MITGWDYPAEFYARLPQHWPELSFVCSVNEDTGGFGGIVMVLDALPHVAPAAARQW